MFCQGAWLAGCLAEKALPRCDLEAMRKGQSKCHPMSFSSLLPTGFTSGSGQSQSGARIERTSAENVLLFSFLVQPFIQSFTLQFMHSVTQPVIHSFAHSFLPSFLPSLIRSFVPSFIHSFVHPFRPFIPLIPLIPLIPFIPFIHSLIDSFIHSFIHAPIPHLAELCRCNLPRFGLSRHPSFRTADHVMAIVPPEEILDYGPRYILP